MKNKERLLSFDEPVRFIFSHSALREGWDNPNVFQICALRMSNSEIKKRQEVGRGLRLAVDQTGERQDSELLGAHGVHDVNALTVIANESYETFARGLQDEFYEVIKSRPKEVSEKLFENTVLFDNQLLFSTCLKLPFHSAQFFGKHIHIAANLAVNHFGVNLHRLDAGVSEHF
jgi:type III restriction enzyme